MRKPRRNYRVARLVPEGKPCVGRSKPDGDSTNQRPRHGLPSGTSRGAGRPGFTLVEAIASIVVLGTIAAVSSGLILEASDRYVQATVRAQLHTEASIAMDRMVRELRSMPVFDTGSGLAPTITAVSASSITFDSGTTYQLTSDRLMHSAGGASDAPLLTDVTQFAVQVFDADDVPLPGNLAGAQCEPIRRIRLSVTLERSGVSETLSAKLFLRGLIQGSGA